MKAVTLYKSLENKKRKLGTNFILLCQSRNMVGQFKKDYLHRPIKFLHFLTPVRIQKCLKTLKYFSLFKNKPPVSWVAHITKHFLACSGSHQWGGSVLPILCSSHEVRHFQINFKLLIVYTVYDLKIKLNYGPKMSTKELAKLTPFTSCGLQKFRKRNH